MPSRIPILSIAAVVLAATVPSAPARGAERWSVTVYEAVLVDAPMLKLPWRLDETRWGYRLVAVAGAGRWARFGRELDLEGEMQVARQVLGSDRVELNALCVARWRRFPWDRVLDTSFALGAGLSWASSPTPFEVDWMGHESALLAAVLWELEAAPPGERSRWSVVARLHHRSGGYGFFNDVRTGSNALGLGLKVRL